ncbi:MAG TPA: YihY/virulence factor BrkB family protein [bacterium]|nr:YihY/virulence factor BrkB family protein [bacterium]
MPGKLRARTAKFTQAGRFLVALYDHARGDDIFTLAASIAYAALLSVFPLLLALIAFMELFIARGHAQQTVMYLLAPYLPPSALTMIRRTLVAVRPTAGTGGAAALVGLLWSATAIASAARHSLNRVLRARRQRAFWHRKLVELSMVLVVGIFLGLSLLASAIVTLPVFQPLTAAVHYLLNTPLGAAVGWVSSALFAWLAFLIVYRFLPSARVQHGRLLVGGLWAVVLFEVIKSGFFWYLRTAAGYPAVYGPVVGVVVFMIWIYLVAFVLLIGAEVMATHGGRDAPAVAAGQQVGHG